MTCPGACDSPEAGNPNVATYTSPFVSTVRPSGGVAPGGSVAKVVAGLRIHAAAGTETSASASRTARAKYQRFCLISDLLVGAASQRRIVLIGTAIEASRSPQWRTRT